MSTRWQLAHERLHANHYVAPPHLPISNRFYWRAARVAGREGREIGVVAADRHADHRALRRVCRECGTKVAVEYSVGERTDAHGHET